MTWFLATLAHLIHLATSLLQTYGLWGLFGLLLAENLGVIFAPGESVVVTAGFLAAKGVFSIAVGAVIWVLFWGGGAWWLAQSIPSGTMAFAGHSDQLDDQSRFAEPLVSSRVPDRVAHQGVITC